MPIIVHSPYSGHPVKVRDEDLGRAIRDESGKVFYVVARSEGSGYYGSATRHGSAEDEAKYDALVQESQAASAEPVEAGSGSAKPAVHDATGKPSTDVARSRRIILYMAIFVLLLVLYLWYVKPAMAQPEGVETLPPNPALVQQPVAEEDPVVTEARNWFSFRVFAIGVAGGIVFIYFLGKWANRKRADRLADDHATDVPDTTVNG